MIWQKDISVWQKRNVKLKINKNVIKFAQLLLLILIGLVLGRMVYVNWQEIINYSWEFDPIYLSLSFLFLLAHFIFISIGWQKLVILTGGRLSLTASIKINSFSGITRYLPGGMWDHVSRFVLTKTTHKGRDGYVALSTILNVVLIILAGLLTFLFSLVFFTGYKNLDLVPYSMVLIPVGLISLHPRFLEKVINFVLPKLGKTKLEISFTYPDILKISGWFFLSWIAIGISLYLLVRGLTPISISLLPAVIGIFSISWLVGALTPIAPQGAGVREASLILLLVNIIPEPIAIVSALSSRTLIIVRDLILAAVATKIKNEE